MALRTVGPKLFSKLPHAGHRKSSYMDSTTFGSELPSFLTTLLDAPRMDLIPPDCGFLFDKMKNAIAAANTTTTKTSPIWIVTLRLRSAAFRSYRLGFVATGSRVPAAHR